MARIDSILKLVRDQGASDLHLTTGSPPMIRIHGEITAVPHEPLSREACELLLFEIMDAGVRARYEQQKDVDFSYEVPGIARARCNIFEHSKGPAGAFRMLPNDILSMEQLGLPPSLARFTELPRGLVVVTGPPGTGKSSTLAALIDHINVSQKKHILTIEDPIEFASSPSARWAATRRASRRRSTPRSARIRTSSWSARCATWRRWRWR